MDKPLQISTDTLQTLDLRGQRCPLNFVHAKVSLEDCAIGEQVQILCDTNEAKQLLASLENIAQVEIMTVARQSPDVMGIIARVQA